MIKETRIDNLLVRVFENRIQLGEAAAEDAADYIIKLLKEKQEINIVFAAAPSQNEFLKSLIQTKGIDWTRINAFHMDEYIGLQDDAPQGFGNFLKDAIFSKAPFRSVNYLLNGTKNATILCDKYINLLKESPIDIVFMGIGENGHIAFNDPHVALFNDPETVKIVELDLACRIQQVNDGCFDSVNSVPTHAITLTIPTLLSAKRLFCMVPGKLKANAVKNTLLNEIDTACPATILRKHSKATLYCDRESASGII